MVIFFCNCCRCYSLIHPTDTTNSNSRKRVVGDVDDIDEEEEDADDDGGQHPPATKSAKHGPLNAYFRSQS